MSTKDHRLLARLKIFRRNSGIKSYLFKKRVRDFMCLMSLLVLWLKKIKLSGILAFYSNLQDTGNTNKFYPDQKYL